MKTKEVQLENETRTVRVYRILRAPGERVFKAFTEKNALEHWLPPYGFTAMVKKIDVRVGGGYRISFTNFHTGSSNSFKVKFIEIVTNKRIWYTHRLDDANSPGDKVVLLELETVSCGTRLSIVQEGIPSTNPIEMNYLGWQSLLQLVALVETDNLD